MEITLGTIFWTIIILAIIFISEAVAIVRNQGRIILNQQIISKQIEDQEK